MMNAHELLLLAQDTTPWFTNYGMVGGVLGSAVGIFGGGIYGPLVGTLAPQGKARGLVFGYHWALVLAGIGLVLAGAAAMIDHQPFAVTACLGGPGLLLLMILLPLTPVLKHRYAQAEHRRLEAEEFRRA